MSRRDDLPNRRAGVILETAFGGQPYAVHYGWSPSGRLAELFISTKKTSSQSESNARDAAIILSLAMQYGAPFEALRKSVTRDEHGAAATIVGHALDLVARDFAKLRADNPQEFPEAEDAR